MLIRSKTLGHSKRLFHLSLGAFLVFLGAFVVCSNVDFSESVEATDVSSKFTVSLNDVLTISSPSSIILDNCNPSTASLCTASATVNVSTNNLTGYSLYLNATSGSSNSLTNTAVTPNPTIPTLSQSYSSANFPVNSWGYTGGTDQSGNSGYNCSTNYCPILDYEADPEDYSPNHLIKETSAPAATSNTNLTFAAKANTSKASGTYTTSITFTAVANEVPITTMQDFDADACAAATTDQTFNLVDTRDGTWYTVAKLRDGNCWMTQNLALGGSSAMTLTPADTNIASNFTLPASVVEGSWAESLDDPEFFDYVGNYPSQQASNKYGNYYNWPAATAGSGTFDTSDEVQYDICPKNWRLPSAGTAPTTGNEFYTMISNYITAGTWDDSDPITPYWSNITTSDFTNTPVSLVFSGSYSSGSLIHQGDYGFWPSSTAYDNYNAYYLTVNDSDNVAYPNIFDSKTSGVSIRCLVNIPRVKNGMYMQDVTQEHIANTPTDVTYTLKDARDEKEYTVAKLQDGNLWMTQNLALGGSSAMTLTPADTNIASNFTLPASETEGYWSSSTTDPEFFDYAGNYPSQQATNKYGNYYNWPATTAGSGTFALNQDGDEAPYSICPKNWRLPSTTTVATDSEFYTMLNNYIATGTWGGTSWSGVTTTNFTNAPVSLVFSGIYYGVLDDQGNNGGWWSSTAYDSGSAYQLLVSSNGSVYPRSNYGSKGGSNSIRCLIPSA